MQRRARDNTTGRATSAPHLPALWPDQPAYEQLCREGYPFGHYSEHNGPWKEIRIPFGTTAEEVYRRLPSNLDFEYGGYITRTRIYYCRCARHRASIPTWKTCTFHSHPTILGRTEPDLPSPCDIRMFLVGRHWRTITIGRSLAWVWDKTEGTFPVIRRFVAWEKEHLTRKAGKLIASGVADWETKYVTQALRAIGIVVPDDRKRWGKVWPQMLSEKLHFTVTLFDRDC